MLLLVMNADSRGPPCEFLPRAPTGSRISTALKLLISLCFGSSLSLYLFKENCSMQYIAVILLVLQL